MKEVNLETLLFLCLKMIAYPLRTYYKNVRGDENSWSDVEQSKIVW